jgi:hypothetical protein
MVAQKNAGGRGSGAVLTIVAALLIGLLGLASGYFIANRLQDLLGVNESAKAAASQLSQTGEKPLPTQANADSLVEKSKRVFEIVPMPPVVTNIADPKTVWVRLEGNLLFDKQDDGDKSVLAAKLAQHIMAYLNTVNLIDLQGAGSVHAISEDIDEIVQSLSENRVEGLLISGLVFE